MIQKNIEEFSRLQDYMLEDGKDAKAYNTMLKRYLDLKAILQSFDRLPFTKHNYLYHIQHTITSR